VLLATGFIELYACCMKRVFVFLIFILTCSSVLHALGYEEEREISREVDAYFEAAGYTLNDSEATWLVQSLVDQLQSHIKDPVYNIKVQIVKDPEVNAFAITDGHIYVNSGTLIFIKDMDELAAILAHEMGHCQLRHIPQSMNEQTKLTAASIAGMIIGAIVTIANPPVGSAILMSSVGGAQNMSLAYSRRHEEEADEFGLKLLKESGMDPSAMERFLIRLRTYNDASNVPEYMLTHPYTQERIAKVGVDDIKPPKPDARFWLLYSTILGGMMDEKGVKVRSSGMPDMYRNYALGVSRAKNGKYKESLTALEGVEFPQAKSWMGIDYYYLGEKDKALQFLKADTRNPQAAIALADIQLQNGQYDDAIALLVPISSQSPKAAYSLGVLYEKKGKDGLSHFAFARYFLSTHDFGACMYHIDKALNDKSLDEETVSQLKQMKDLVKKASKP
jgi:predicted Zn-dependent protease